VFVFVSRSTYQSSLSINTHSTFVVSQSIVSIRSNKLFQPFSCIFGNQSHAC
jgi:hypothetical protein